MNQREDVVTVISNIYSGGGAIVHEEFTYTEKENETLRTYNLLTRIDYKV